MRRPHVRKVAASKPPVALRMAAIAPSAAGMVRAASTHQPQLASVAYRVKNSPERGSKAMELRSVHASMAARIAAGVSANTTWSPKMHHSAFAKPLKSAPKNFPNWSPGNCPHLHASVFRGYATIVGTKADQCFFRLLRCIRAQDGPPAQRAVGIGHGRHTNGTFHPSGAGIECRTFGGSTGEFLNGLGPRWLC
jgi:hypothetical protein